MVEPWDTSFKRLRRILGDAPFTRPFYEWELWTQLGVVVLKKSGETEVIIRCRATPDE